MTGRRLFWAALPALALALVAATLRARDLLSANLVLRQVEQLSLVAIAREHQDRAAGRAGRQAPVYWAHVQLLAEAERRAPADARLPLARGSQYLLLGRADEAIAAYEEALALEPRPEIYLNLGRAQLGAGNAGDAAKSFHRALVLDPFLRPQVPAEVSR